MRYFEDFHIGDTFGLGPLTVTAEEMIAIGVHYVGRRLQGPFEATERSPNLGVNYPLITPDRWLADFEKINIRPEVRPLILKENAVRLLGLDAPQVLPEVKV